MVTADPVRALIHPGEVPPNTDEALRYCRAMAHDHYENFTVVSWLAPRRMRTALGVLYAYCRTVDDIGDEAPGDRLALLDRFHTELVAAYHGTARHPVFVALQEIVRRHDLPREPFERLIEANRRDQVKTRYQTFEELLEYCTYSANPVGRLVLALYEFRDEVRQSRSDATCTALQLTNFWQDVKRDAAMGRIYLPAEDLDRFDVTEADLHARHGSAAFRRMMEFQVKRARDFFAEGLPLLDLVHGHLKFDLALFSQGGLAILDKIEAADYDTVHARPHLSGRDKVRLALDSIRPWRWRQWI
jgi:squalene synthase HpnC